LQQANVEVRVLDLVVYPSSESDLAQLLDEFKPDLVGLTAVTMNIDRAFAVAEDVKRLAPEILTVMGGPHVTFSARESLAACSALDAAVLGEGEQTLVELCRAVERGQRLDSVKGLVFRSEQGVCFTGRRGFIRNLDRLPMPARHLLPLGRYRALGMPISMTTSRGCPHACIFCVGRRMVGARVRFHSPARVVDEMEQIAGLGFHQINLADDLFTADRHRCAAVCDEILRRGLQTQWTSFARVDTVSEDLLRRMRAAGCTAVSFGIESANTGILKTIRKGITLDGAGTGAAFFVNGIFQGIELFDREATFGKMFPKLLSGVAVEAMMAQGERLSARRAKSPEETMKYVHRILAEVSKSLFEKFDPVGVGEDWRYDAKRSFGKALHYEADLIHFSAFGK